VKVDRKFKKRPENPLKRAAAERKRELRKRHQERERIRSLRDRYGRQVRGISADGEATALQY
jgi:hypothetical protein